MNNDIEERVNFYEEQRQSLNVIFKDPEFSPTRENEIILKWNQSIYFGLPIVEHNKYCTYIYDNVAITTVKGIIRKKRNSVTNKKLLFTIRNDIKTVFVYDEVIYKLVKRWAKENDMITMIKSWEGAK